MTSIVTLLPTVHDITKMFSLAVLLQIGIWLYRIAKRFYNTERVKLIRQHVRAGHTDPLKNCLHPDCQPLRHL